MLRSPPELVPLPGTLWGYANEEREGATYITLRRLNGTAEAGPYWWSVAKRRLIEKPAHKGRKGTIRTTRPAYWDSAEGKREEQLVHEAVRIALGGKRKPQEKEQPRTLVVGGPFEVVPGLELTVVREMEFGEAPEEEDPWPLVDVRHHGVHVGRFCWLTGGAYLDELDLGECHLVGPWWNGDEQASSAADGWLSAHSVEAQLLEDFIRRGGAGGIIAIRTRPALPPPFEGYEKWLSTVNIGAEVLECYPGAHDKEGRHYNYHWAVVTLRLPDGGYQVSSGKKYGPDGAYHVGPIVYARIEPPVEPLREQARRDHIRSCFFLIEKKIDALPLDLLENLMTAAGLNSRWRTR